MRLSRIGNNFAGAVNSVVKPLSAVACGVLAIMVLLIFANVFGRFLLNKPLMGIVELVELMMVIIAMFAMPYTAIKRAHVRVDLFIRRASRRLKIIITSITFFLGAGIFAIITYESIISAIAYAHNLADATSVLFIPYAPFRAILALGCLLLTMVFLVCVFRPLPPEEEQKGGAGK